MTRKGGILTTFYPIGLLPYEVVGRYRCVVCVDFVWTLTFDGHFLLLVVEVWRLCTRGWVGEVCELRGFCRDSYL